MTTPWERTNISTGTKWEPLVGYSRAVRVGPHVLVAGTLAVDDAGEVVAPGDGAPQTTFIIRKIEAALNQCGATLADVVRTRMYVTDIDQWESIGRAHGEFFSAIRPASTMIEVSRLAAPGTVVEIEVDAIISGA